MTANGPRIFRAAAALAALMIALPAQGAPEAAGEASCFMRLGQVADAPRFEDFPAARQRITRQGGPILSTREARTFRSTIGAAAAQGPNFAGAYTVAVWGCGGSCTDFAVVDNRNGHVTFTAGLRPIAGDHGGYAPDYGAGLYYNLRFRPDSRLLILVGAPREDESRDGVTFLEWRDGTFHELRFIPRAQVCASTAHATEPAAGHSEH
ncbi:MAG TPA: hypothetical protein VIT38_09565 [Allosphingosinicella sp.]